MLSKKIIYESLIRRSDLLVTEHSTMYLLSHCHLNPSEHKKRHDSHGKRDSIEIHTWQF